MADDTYERWVFPSGIALGSIWVALWSGSWWAVGGLLVGTVGYTLLFDRRAPDA